MCYKNVVTPVMGIDVILGLPTMFHIFAHTVPVEERSRAFGYLVALGSVGQTVAAVVCLSLASQIFISMA